MNWKNLPELPDDMSVVMAKIKGRKELTLCTYKNKSFGIGEDDSNVVSWTYIVRQRLRDLKSRLQHLKPTSPVVDHKGESFSELCYSPVLLEDSIRS